MKELIIVVLLCICLSFIPTVSATFQQAKTAYNSGNYIVALHDLKQALQQDPKNVSIVTDIGSTFSELGNYLQAISFYNKALLIAPHHLGAIIGLGGAFDMLGNCCTSRHG